MSKAPKSTLFLSIINYIGFTRVKGIHLDLALMKSFPNCTAQAIRDLRRQDIDSNKFVIKSWKTNSAFSWPYFLCFFCSSCVLPKTTVYIIISLPWILSFQNPFLLHPQLSLLQDLSQMLFSMTCPGYFFPTTFPFCLCHSLLQVVGFVSVLLTSTAQALHLGNGMLHFTRPPCSLC